MGDRELLIVAGEASGDLHGARLLENLRYLNPEISAFGLGGHELRSAGFETLADSSEITVVGIYEALSILRRAREIFSLLLEEVDRRRPRAAVLIDFPEFNLRLANQLHRRGVKVIYYISPQIWAWRRGRVKTVSRIVDKMLVILPFEVDFYRRHGVEAVNVGHPLVDEVPVLPHIWDAKPADSGPFQLALLPGSRPSEIKAILPLLLKTGRQLADKLPAKLSLIKAPTVADELLADQLRDSGVDLEIVSHNRFQAIASSHLALCASGTAALEVGLLGTPMIVVYRVGFWSHMFGRLLVRLPHVSLVNLVLGEAVVPELLQNNAVPEKIAHTAKTLVTQPERIRIMRNALQELRDRLGDSGASRRAAEEVLHSLEESRP